MFLQCLGRKDGQCLQVFSSVLITAKAKNGPESVLVNQRRTHQFGQKEGLYLLLTNVSCCPISGCHSNVTLEALSHGSDGYGVMQAHCTHTRGAQATTVSIFILHTLSLFAECRMSPETAAGKPLPKGKACSAKFCSVFS